jgi:hypothetical protein
MVTAGPEVVAQAVRVLEVVSEAAGNVELTLEAHDFGGCAIDKTGEPLPPSTLKACQEADAILMGAGIVFLLLSWRSFCDRFHRWAKMGSGRQSTARARPAGTPKSSGSLREHPTGELCF